MVVKGFVVTSNIFSGRPEHVNITPPITKQDVKGSQGTLFLRKIWIEAKSSKVQGVVGSQENNQLCSV